jgi:hypothetical protein
LRIGSRFQHGCTTRNAASLAPKCTSELQSRDKHSETEECLHGSP